MKYYMATTGRRYNKNGIAIGDTPSKYWKKENVNPKKHDTFDCAIRAVSKVLNLKWEDTFDQFSAEARKLGYVTIDGTFADWMLTEYYKFKYVDLSNKRGMTLDKFCETHNDGRFILITEAHAIAVIDGFFYDKANFTERKVQGYYYLEETESVKKDIESGAPLEVPQHEGRYYYENLQYTNMNKKALYESIMKSVAKEVKKALNEGEFASYEKRHRLPAGYREDSMYSDLALVIKGYDVIFCIPTGGDHIADAALIEDAIDEMEINPGDKYGIIGFNNSYCTDVYRLTGGLHRVLGEIFNKEANAGRSGCKALAKLITSGEGGMQPEFYVFGKDEEDEYDFRHEYLHTLKNVFYTEY